MLLPPAEACVCATVWSDAAVVVRWTVARLVTSSVLYYLVLSYAAAERVDLQLAVRDRNWRCSLLQEALQSYGTRGPLMFMWRCPHMGCPHIVVGSFGRGGCCSHTADAVSALVGRAAAGCEQRLQTANSAGSTAVACAGWHVWMHLWLQHGQLQCTSSVLCRGCWP